MAANSVTVKTQNTQISPLRVPELGFVSGPDFSWATGVA
jgi:hypothetical protein